MHNRSSKTIAENEVWELWAFLNYSNISIFLRVHSENSVATLFTQTQKGYSWILPTRDRDLCFAKLKKSKICGGNKKKGLWIKNSSFQSVVQSWWEISQKITKKSPQQGDINWQSVYFHFCFSYDNLPRSTSAKGCFCRSDFQPLLMCAESNHSGSRNPAQIFQ